MNVVNLIILTAISLNSIKKIDSFKQSIYRCKQYNLVLNLHNGDSQFSSPTSEKLKIVNRLVKAGCVFSSQLLLLNTVNNIKSADAVGSLYEFKNQPMIIQDVSFNVESVPKEIDLLEAFFVGQCKPIRVKDGNGETEAVIAFGSDSYEKIPTFFPGVSSFSEYGGDIFLNNL